MSGRSNSILAATVLLVLSLLAVRVSFAFGERPSSEPDSMKVVEMDSIVVTGIRRTDAGFSFTQPKNEMQSIPIAATDPTRALALLPSSVPVSDIKSMPTIAGDEPDRMLVLLDGVPVSLPVRLLGTFSVFNPIVTRSIDVTASGFSAAYGNAFPAGINVRTDESSEATVIKGAFDLTSSTVGLGLPISHEPGEYLTTAFRMSHIQAVSPLLSSSARERLESFTPQLRDAYANVNLVPSYGWNLRLQTLMTSENGSLSSQDRSFGYTWRKTFFNTQARATLGKSITTVGISWSRDVLDLSSEIPVEEFGSLHFSTFGSFNVGRGVIMFDTPMGTMVSLKLGTEVTLIGSRINFGSSSGWLNRQSPLRQLFTNVALHGEVTIAELLSCATVTVGVRASYFGLLNSVGVEPRIEVGADLGNSTQLRAGYGRYLAAASNLQVLQGFLSFLSAPNQPPRMMVTKSGNPALPEESNAWAASLSKELQVATGVSASFSVDGYYKSERNLIQSVRYPAVFTVLDSNSFEPSQRFSGRKYGIGGRLGMSITDLDLKVSASSYLQHSSTKDTRTNTDYPNGSDIPQSMKVLIAYEPGPVHVVVTFQHYSGPPATDRYFLKGTTLMGGEFFFPVDRELNSSRLPDYNRVDVGMSYKLSLGGWQIEPYLQILNVLNSRNVSGFSYFLSSDRQDNVRAVPEYNTFPIVPFAGVRVERTW